MVSAVGGSDKSVYLDTARTLVESLAPLGETAPRIVHSGGGATLLDAEGVRFADKPGFPPELLDEVLGQAAALDYYRASTGVTWTYLSPPPGDFAPGERLGHYRIGDEHPVTRPDGTFGISYEDYAIALIDEIETPAHLNARFTVGY
jgi:putative NADH-flavin reductase